ncbi:uncharacterized protein ISCGN_006260 [Ixodes scapularis]
MRDSAYLEAEKMKQREDAKQAKKRCIDEEIDTMKAKKRKLEATMADLTASADAYAEKANDLTYIVKSNSLRKTAKSKAEELLSISQHIQEELQELP